MSKDWLLHIFILLLIALLSLYLWDSGAYFKNIMKQDFQVVIAISTVYAIAIGIFAVTTMKIHSQKTEMIKLNNELNEKSNWLQGMAYKDSLTGLPNRLALEIQLKEKLNEAIENSNKVSILYLNLDRFHHVNTVFGHKTGDLLLKRSAERIIECVEDDIVVRHAGDEFIVLLTDTTEDASVQKAKLIMKAFQKPFVVNKEEIIISVAIGICFNSSFVTDSDTMIQYANQSMVESKGKEIDRITAFTGEFAERMQRKIGLEQSLKRALEKEELYLAYQPLVDLNTKEIIGVEALLRWEHPKYGNITPMEFIPIAEESDLITTIGDWAMREACRQVKIWHKKGSRIYVAVNVSLRQIWQKEFVQTVHTILKETGIEAKYLKVEITESLMYSEVESKQLLRDLKSIGVSLSLDDFGTGFASLSVLGEMPFDYLKIDRSFIKDIPENPRSRAIVNTIIELGKSLGFVVIGEGIEEVKHLDYLKNQGCHIGQGYLFSKPVKAKSIERMLQK